MLVNTYPMGGGCMKLPALLSWFRRRYLPEIDEYEKMKLKPLGRKMCL